MVNQEHIHCQLLDSLNNSGTDRPQGRRESQVWILSASPEANRPKVCWQPVVVLGSSRLFRRQNSLKGSYAMGGMHLGGILSN